jgi:hypothetical protein
MSDPAAAASAVSRPARPSADDVAHRFARRRDEAPLHEGDRRASRPHDGTRRCARQVGAVGEHDPSPVGAIRPVKAAQQRRAAASRRALERDECPRSQVEGDVAQHDAVAERLGESFRAQRLGRRDHVSRLPTRRRV